MLRLSRYAYALCLFPCPLFAQAQTPKPPVREVVVSAARIETERQSVGSSISVIKADEILRRGARSVADILKTVPGVDVVRSGPQGGNVAVFMRGANSEHTLVLIDGVEANDPISPTRVFNFADLPAENIERIEILRGPQSTLYGSDALGGVIAIFTKTGATGDAAIVSVEGGSYDSFVETAELRGALKNFEYSASAQRHDSSGISAADRRDGNTEADGYERTSFSSALGLKLANQLRLDLTGRYLDAEAELDNAGGVGGDDLNRVLDREHLFARAALSGSPFTQELRQVLGVAVSHQSFDDNNEPDALNPFDTLQSSYASRLLKFDLQNEISVSEQLRLIVGVETEEERGSSAYSSDGFFGPFVDNFDSRSARTNSGYLNALLDFGSGLSAAIGGRLDDHSQFGTQESWRFAPSYLINDGNTRVFASLGTGYKAPSLFQLYSSYGNQDLNPEKSVGWDIGIEQSLPSELGLFSVTFFRNDFDNLISFNPETFVSENIAQARSYGFEAALSIRPNDSIDIQHSYTYTDTEDLDKKESLLRRPRHKASVQVVAKLTELFSLDFGASLYGRSFDNDFSSFPAKRVALGSHVITHVGARYQLTEPLEVFARIENAGDKSYQRVLGYGEAGLAAFGGLRLKL